MKDERPSVSHSGWPALLAGLCLAAACVAGEKAAQDRSAPKDKEAFPLVLEHLKVTELFHLDPFATWNDPPEDVPRFQKWVIAESAKPVSSASGQTLMRSMRAIVNAPADWANACFEPHHGVTLADETRTFRVIACFRCARYEVFDSRGKLVWGGTFTNVESEAPVWEKVFGAAGLRPPEKAYN